MFLYIFTLPNPIKKRVNSKLKNIFGEIVEFLSEFLVKTSNKIIFTNHEKWYIINSVT